MHKIVEDVDPKEHNTVFSTTEQVYFVVQFEINVEFNIFINLSHCEFCDRSMIYRLKKH